MQETLKIPALTREQLSTCKKNQKYWWCRTTTGRFVELFDGKLAATRELELVIDEKQRVRLANEMPAWLEKSTDPTIHWATRPSLHELRKNPDMRPITLIGMIEEYEMGAGDRDTGTRIKFVVTPQGFFVGTMKALEREYE